MGAILYDRGQHEPGPCIYYVRTEKVEWPLSGRFNPPGARAIFGDAISRAATVPPHAVELFCSFRDVSSGLDDTYFGLEGDSASPAEFHGQVLAPEARRSSQPRRDKMPTKKVKERKERIGMSQRTTVDWTGCAEKMQGLYIRKAASLAARAENVPDHENLGGKKRLTGCLNCVRSILSFFKGARIGNSAKA